MTMGIPTPVRLYTIQCFHIECSAQFATAPTIDAILGKWTAHKDAFEWTLDEHDLPYCPKHSPQEP